MNSNQASLMRFIFMGLALMLLMVFRPQGIFGDREGAGPRCPLTPATPGTDKVDISAARAALRDVPHEPGAPKPDPIVVVDGVRRTFGGLTAVDVDHVEIQRGVITGLIGPNGAGKTTFFNLLTGFDRPDEGEWSFNGKSLTERPAYRVARRGHGPHLPADQGALPADRAGEHAGRGDRPAGREPAAGHVRAVLAWPGAREHRAGPTPCSSASC